MAAAKEYLKEGNISFRAAAEKHGVNYPSHISYWVKQWRGTLMEQVFANEESAEEPVPENNHDGEGVTTALVPPCTAAEADADDVLPKHTLYRRMVQEGVQLTREGLSLRAAAAIVNEKYSSSERVLSVSHATLKNYQAEGAVLPNKRGREQILPIDFNSKICQHVLALRSLKFPVFRDQIIAAANHTLEGSSELRDKFKDRGVGTNWYYNSFLKEFKHRLGTGSVQPLEIDRAKWATASNIGPWYAMMAEALVEAGVAVRNPDFDADAPAGTTNAMPVFVTKPERILSFDETRSELDMTTTSQAKSEAGVFDRNAPRETRKEAMAAHKGGLSATIVGGGTGDGKALPAFVIFAGESYAARWTRPSPTSHFLGEDSRFISAKFGCNKKGGMQGDYGVMYLRDVVAPCFPNRSEEEKVVVICDGHGSHLTLGLIEWCRENHFSVLLRVPHTSHLTQGEDVVMFRSFKRMLRLEKANKLTQNVANGVMKLRSQDLMACVTPAWEASFACENILKAFKATGIIPFTRCVLFDLIEMERDAQVACARAPGIDYNRLSISSFTGAAAENSDEEDEHARLVNKSRFSSADVYMLGPINSDKTYAIAKERSDAREAAMIAKEQRANARANKKSSKEVEMVSAYNEFN